MKTMKKVLAMLLTVCMAVGCMTVGALAAGSVTKSAFGQSTYPTVSGNYADNVYATVSVDVDETVTDSGKLVLYSNYGLCTVTDWDYLGVTNVKSNNPAVATAEITHNGSNLSVAITGVADGTATITVDYCGQSTVNADQIYPGTEGVANGYIYYTVTVGTGTSTPSTPGGDTGDDDGDGLTVDNKGRYVIYNETDLKAVKNDMAGSYIVANSFSLSSGWTPLGWTDSDDVAFTGTFDGNGYTISNLYNTSNLSGTNVGLFAINEGTIKDLTVELGANQSLIGTAFVGVIAGKNFGTIQNVTATQSSALNSGYVLQGTNDSQTYVGGITGYNGEGGKVLNSCASVAVHGYYFVGGLVGGNFGEITECYCKGSVNNKFNNNSLSYCAYIGGLVGGNKGTITDCYSSTAGVVQGNQYVGGAVGGNYSAGTISNVWVDPCVQALTTSNSGVFAGAQSGSVSQCYVVSTTSGSQGGATRISADGLKDQTGFPAKATNWDFDDTWGYAKQGNYPTLCNSGNSGDHENIVLPSSGYKVTYAKGSVKTGDTVNLPADQTVAAGTTIYLGTPTRTNADEWVYQFCGWTCNKDSNTYMTGAPYEVNSDVTFTATWSLITVDGDEIWTYRDAMLILDYVEGKITLTDEQLAVADYNNDGDVDALDAQAIMNR